MENNRTSNRPARIVALGLEAAEPGLIEKWCNEGFLPTLASLKKQWPFLKIMSTTEVGSGATWPSIFTGVSPAKHGIGFYHRQLKTGTYHLCKKYANQVKRTPFWIQPSKDGKKIGIFDVPVTYPDSSLNGIQIAGWGVEAPSWKKGSWPSDVIKEVSDQYGLHPLEGWYQERPDSLQKWGDFLQKLLFGVRTKGQILNALLTKEDWNLFFCVFPESHWGGHLFWHLMDKTHPNYSAEFAQLYKDGLLQVYRELDSTLAEILEVVPHSTILIFSNTGMGPNYSGTHLLQEILARLGMAGTYQKQNQQKPSLGYFLPALRWGPYAIEKIEGILTPKGVSHIKKLIPERVWDTWTRWILNLGNNWKNSRAFSVPSDYTGLIRINLKGREPNGLVEPGCEYDALCEELTRELNTLINPETGKKAVSKVLRVDQLYQGENLWDLPDLIVRWAGDAPIRALASPRIGRVDGELPDKRTGAHLPYGFLLPVGEHIHPGNGVVEGSIMDIAPTILYLMGQPIPRDMDGKVLFNIIDEEFRVDNPPTYV